MSLLDLAHHLHLHEPDPDALWPWILAGGVFFPAAICGIGLLLGQVGL